MKGISISVVTAAYNEYPGIVGLTKEWVGYLQQHPDVIAFEIIICDDHSSESNYSATCHDLKDIPEVRILRNEVNSGPGFSFHRGFTESTMDWILITDSDGQFPIKNCDLFIEKIKNQSIEAIFSYRNRKYDNLLNRFGQKASNFLCNKIFDSSLKDFTCAFKLVKAEQIKKLSLDARYMNYSLDHTGKLLMATDSWIELPIETKPDKPRKRSVLNEIKRARNRFLYIIYLGFYRYLQKKRITF